MEQRCRQRKELPVFRYEADKPEALNAFVKKHGSIDIRFEKDGKANVFITAKGETRWIYCLPGYWLVCLGDCQFMALAPKKFTDLYELVSPIY